jgi:glycosyltransferase involved in cell wall biosynthesis
MTAPPKLSIGVPVYNGENFLQQAVDSILAQDFRDFELIISDNASTDRTAEICRRYAEIDPRVRYVRLDTNVGGPRNFCYVSELARGEYFKWAAHDDVCAPGFLRRCVETLDAAAPEVVLVYPRTQMINESGVPIPWDIETVECTQRRPHQRLALVLRELSVLSAQFGVIRTAALRRTRLLDSFFASDYVLLAELAMLGQFLEIPEPLFLRRLHPMISSRANVGWDQLQSWWNPGHSGYRLPISPMVGLGYEYVRSINRLDLPLSDKCLCYPTAVYVWYVRELRIWAGRQRNRLMKKLRPTLEAKPPAEA